jgi:hypothetical protein
MNRLRLILLQVLSICISQLKLLSITTLRKSVLLTFDISLFFTRIFRLLSCVHCLVWKRIQCVFNGFIDRLFISKYCSTILVFCILASCYIRFTLNICSFVHQCNTFTFYLLLLVDMFRHGSHKDNTTILTNSKHNISRSTWLATSHRQKLA